MIAAGVDDQLAVLNDKDKPVLFVDAVEQTYMGNPTSTIADIASQSLPPKAVAKKSAGTQTVMTAETASPQAQMGSIGLRGVFANPELDA